MAVRERKRRAAAEEEDSKRREEEEKKSKSKEREIKTPPPGVRRSARNNGLEPELTITDPSRLERRLNKRSRMDGASGDSNGSEDENRDAKRSRVSGDEDGDGDRDPLNIGDGTPARPRVVTFDQILVDGQVPTPPIDAGQQNPVNWNSNSMVVDPVEPWLPQPNGGFDPGLLNPAPTSLPPTPALEDDPFSAGPSSHGVGGPSSMTLQAPDTAPPPFVLATTSGYQNPLPSILKPSSRTSKSPMPERIPTPTPMPMPIIERTPTPPLPDFHVDESLLSQLQASLRMSTASLTVEQLEQLRATCLGNVWRHRSEWDRDKLVRELQDVVQDFVAEVNADDSEVEDLGMS